MPLFVAQHRHPPETCSAFLTGSALLSRVSAAAAARHAVSIEAEALIDQEHRLLLVVEAANRQAVEDFLAFLHQEGELQVLAASTVEEAAERGGCSSAPKPFLEEGGQTQTQSTLRRAVKEEVRR